MAEIRDIQISAGLPEPEPPFLAGAGAVFLVRHRLLLLRDPKYDYYDYDCDYD